MNAISKLSQLPSELSGRRFWHSSGSLTIAFGCKPADAYGVSERSYDRMWRRMYTACVGVDFLWNRALNCWSSMPSLIQSPAAVIHCRETGGQKSAQETANACRDRKAGTIPANIPAETAYLEFAWKPVVRSDWMVAV